MFQLVAFSESQDEAGAYTRMAAVPDQSIRAVGDTITIGELDRIIASAAFLGALGDEARLISPSLRRINPLSITPVELALFPGARPAMMYHGDSPIPLKTNEALEAENNSNPAAAEQHAVLVWLSDGEQLPVKGEIHTVNCTVTMAQVIDSWEFSEITFPDSLPVGDYDVVGARLEAAAAIAFRFVPVGKAYRPGGICAQLASSYDPFMQRFGRLGRWFDFNTVQPPGVELLGSAAAGSATYDLFLDLMAK